MGDRLRGPSEPMPEWAKEILSEIPRRCPHCGHCAATDHIKMKADLTTANEALAAKDEEHEKLQRLHDSVSQIARRVRQERDHRIIEARHEGRDAAAKLVKSLRREITRLDAVAEEFRAELRTQGEECHLQIAENTWLRADLKVWGDHINDVDARCAEIEAERDRYKAVVEKLRKEAELGAGRILLAVDAAAPAAAAAKKGEEEQRHDH